MSELKTIETVVLTVDKEYYSEHIDVFSSPKVSIKSVFVSGEDHEGDEMHKKLLKNYMKAKTDLRDWEFNKRHNQL